MARALCTRRSFCARAAKTAAGLPLLHAAAMGHPVSRRGAAESKAGTVTLDLNDGANEPLRTVGGSVYVETNEQVGRIIVVRLSKDEVSAFSAICTHMGCEVGLPDGGVAECPCHGSQFDERGQVTRGPAGTDLEGFPATLNDDMITIDLDPTSVSRAMREAAPGVPIAVDIRRGSMVLTFGGEGRIMHVGLYRPSGSLVARLDRVDGRRYFTDLATVAPGMYVVKVHGRDRRYSKAVRIGS